MASSFTARRLSGRLVTSDVGRLLEPGTFRTESVGLPLDTKAFQGDGVASARAGQLYPEYNAALTGNAATTAAGTLTPAPITYDVGIETFTDTNGTTITSHNEWSAWYTNETSGTDPTIQTNRLRSDGTTSYWTGYFDTAPYGDGADQTYEAVLYRRTTNTGGGANEITEGLITRYAWQGSGWDGYIFGWSENDDTWYLKRKLYYTAFTDLSSSTTNAFSGTSQSRTIKVVLSDTSTKVNIKCYVNDTLVIDYDDTDAGRYSYPPMVAALYFYNSESVEFDSLNFYESRNILAPTRATLTQGALDRFVFPTGAWLSPGLRATLAQGGITPTVDYGGVVQALTGLATTTTGGTIGRHLFVGWPDASLFGPITPLVTATKHTYSTGQWYRPHSFDGQLVYANGVFRASGWEYYPTFAADYTRYGGISFSAGVGWGFGTVSLDEIYMDYTLQQWPRNSSGFPNDQYTDVGASEASAVPTLFSVDPDGNVHTGTQRFRNLNSARTPQFGWQHTNILVGRYKGPELRANVFAMYATSGVTAVAFYTIPTALTGVDAVLLGGRVVTNQGVLAALNQGTGGAPELTGHALTGIAGSLRRLPSETGATVEWEISTHPGIGDGGVGAKRITTHGGLLLPINSSDVKQLVARTISAVDSVWSPEIRFGAPSGSTRSYLTGEATMVPSGSPNIFYIVYASEWPTSATTVDRYIGLAVFNAATQTVVSNVQTASIVASSSYGGFQRRNVAEVLRQAGGNNYAQFCLGRDVIHLAWTNGAPTTPTMTLKSLPTPVANREVFNFDSFEVRGDAGYHALYQNNTTFPTALVLDPTTLYVNDVTSTSSTWTTLTPTLAGDGGDAYDYLGGAQFSASGGGKIASHFMAGPVAGFADKHSTVIQADFWKGQPLILTNEAFGRVGQVTVSNTPNGVLVGHRATTTGGPFLNIASGADRTQLLVGKRLTLTSGLCTPPRILFVLDTFTDTNGTLLTAHTAEIGTPWERSVAYANNIIISGNAAQYNNAVAVDANVMNIATGGVSPIRDYIVEARASFNPVGGWYAGELNGAIVARTDANGLTGYLFGRVSSEHKWVLYKRNRGQLASYLGLPSSGNVVNALISIEVIGQDPTRIICSVNKTVVIDYIDTQNDTFGAPYHEAGHAGVYVQDLYNYVSASFDSINAYYYDPTAFIIDGLRAVTGQGQLTGPWPTGQRATLSQGILDPTTPTIEVALTGYAATTAQGELRTIPGWADLVGEVATTAHGTLVPSVLGGYVAIGLLPAQLQTYSGVMALSMRETPGERATLAQGVFGFVLDAYPGLTGAAATGDDGLIVAQIDKGIDGYGATGSVGTHVPEIAAPHWSWGWYSRGRVGQLGTSKENLAALTGNAATTAQGVLTPVTAHARALTGAAATLTVGTMVPVITLVPLGRRATGSAGELVPTLTLALTGYAATGTEGVLGKNLDKLLNGLSGDAEPGLLGYAYGGSVYVTGVYATGYVGDVSRGMRKAAFDESLWVKQGVEDTFVSIPEGKDFPVVEPID